jgi:hypothetical protein
MSNALENQIKLTAALDAKTFGATGDGTTDDYTALAGRGGRRGHCDQSAVPHRQRRQGQGQLGPTRLIGSLGLGLLGHQ